MTDLLAGAQILRAKAQADQLFPDEVARALARQQSDRASFDQATLAEVPADVCQALAAAEGAYQVAQINAAVLQQPALAGDARERALQRLEFEERQRDARQALATAQQQLVLARQAVEQAQRQAARQKLSAQIAVVERLRARRADADRRYQDERAAIEQDVTAAERALERLRRLVS